VAITLIVLYPIFALLSRYQGAEFLRPLALFCLLSGVFFPALARAKVAAWLAYILLCCALAAAVALRLERLLLHLPPLLFLSIAASVFWGSLMPGRRALISVFGESLDGPMSGEVEAYTRSLTIFWAVLLSAQLALSLYLSIFGPEWLWSWVTNVLNYLVLGLVFIGEYLWRRRRFPERKHLPFLEFMKKLSKFDVRKSR